MRAYARRRVFKRAMPDAAKPTRYAAQWTDNPAASPRGTAGGCATAAKPPKACFLQPQLAHTACTMDAALIRARTPATTPPQPRPCMRRPQRRQRWGWSDRARAPGAAAAAAAAPAAVVWPAVQESAAPPTAGRLGLAGRRGAARAGARGAFVCGPQVVGCVMARARGASTLQNACKAIAPSCVT